MFKIIYYEKIFEGTQITTRHNGMTFVLSYNLVTLLSNFNPKVEAIFMFRATSESRYNTIIGD